MSEMAEWEGRMGGERGVEGKPKWKGGVASSIQKIGEKGLVSTVCACA